MLLTTSTLCSDEAFVEDICTDRQTDALSGGKATGEKHYIHVHVEWNTLSPHP